MGLFDGLLKDGVSALGGAVGGMARDVRAAITGKEVITAEERSKILDNIAQMEQLALKADQAINEGQMKINEIEAASPSLFKSGWRPACSWVCITGLAYNFIICPILPWTVEIICHAASLVFPTVVILTHKVPVMPSIDMGPLMTLLLGLLGLGGLRTLEKVKGVDSSK